MKIRANLFAVFIKSLPILFALSFSPISLAETDKYLINPGDVLDISVWNEETLKREVLVLPDGNIGFPLAGTVLAAGRSADDVKKELTKKLTEFIAEPVVNVVIKSTEGYVVYVTGEVKTPGKFVMTEPMTVMQVLSLAGGFTQFAAKNDIVIIRKTSKGSESLKFEYSDLEDGKQLQNNHQLKSGDVIVVP